MPDLPDKPRGSKPYLPPPPDPRDDSAEAVHFPRMDPPPAQLVAMVRRGARSPLSSARKSTWLWVLAIVIGIAVAASLLGLHR